MDDRPEAAARSCGSSATKWVVAVAIFASTLYCVTFLIPPAPEWPDPIRVAIRRCSGCIHAVVDVLFGLAGATPPRGELRSGIYLLIVAGVVPWLIAILLGRGRPKDIGLRRANLLGWRLALVGYVLSLPFLLWMVRSPDFAPSYLWRLERAGGVAFCLYYTVNMLTEHFFLHGMLLALFRPGFRWPAPAPLPSDAPADRPPLLRWLGFAQSTHGAAGLQRITRWIGLPDGCVAAVLASAMLFGLVHVPKDTRELLLSVPGGVALAFLAYRTNTWLTPLVLHLATAGTAFALVLFLS